MLVGHGRLDGMLRVPNAAGDMFIEADLRGQNVSVSAEIGAPQDKGAKGRVTWLVSQLREAPPDLVVEAYPRNARAPISARLSAVVEDRFAVIGEDKREPTKFRLVLRSRMGVARKAGTRTLSFVESVADTVSDFYEGVLQDLVAWQATAPKLTRVPDQDPIVAGSADFEDGENEAAGLANPE